MRTNAVERRAPYKEHMTERAQLPRIVRFFGEDDCIGASCPHCGATGRYIWRFQVADGRELGAMRGCVKLFPVSRIATEQQRLMRKAREFLAKGWKLGPNDSGALEALEKFYQGELDEKSALFEVDRAKSANTARYRRRRR